MFSQAACCKVLASGLPVIHAPELCLLLPTAHHHALPFHTGIPQLVALLQSQGKNVFLVSGGFRQVIHPIAESLNIPVPGNVFANQLLFKVMTQGF